MGLTKRLESMARRFLPASGARFAKRMVAPIRYRAQLKACRAGYRSFGSRYPQTTLFVAGLPKSGTTWLERMIGSYEGFHEVMPAPIAGHEMRTGGSHDFELPEGMFGDFDRALVLTKLHVHGSTHNVKVLADAGVNYVVLFRDLRDVAVSNFFYVRNTPWHPEHPHYAGVDVKEGLAIFAHRTLPAYAAWVRSWDRNRDPDRSVVLRYEQLLADPRGAMRSVARLFGLDDSETTIDRIVELNSFKAMSGGRERGESSTSDFARKGVAGDWVNHFDDSLRTLYDGLIGDFLIEFGYEASHDWARARSHQDTSAAKHAG